DRVGDAPLGRVAHDDAIHHDVEVVLALRIDGDLVTQADHRAVDARAPETFAAQAIDVLAESPPVLASDGGEQRQPRAFTPGDDGVDDFLDGVGIEHASGLRTVGNTYTRVQ